MIKEEVPVITIDGPSGTGKGTLCKLLARHLGWHRLDSDCIYRALAFLARKKHINFDSNAPDIPNLVAAAQSLDLVFEDISLNEERILLEQEEVSKQLRTEQCGLDASQIAQIPAVRAALLARQRAFARFPGLVTDGRDMGTVVFPNAKLKIYLDASAEERASRRYLQLKGQGFNASLAEVVDDSAKRDQWDSARLHAPLKPASEAVFIDTTGLTIAQTLDKVLQLVE